MTRYSILLFSPAAGVDGKWFLKLSENEKKEFYPGWEGMKKRSVLTELIQYAQIVSLRKNI
jgi:hypothetical protein